MYQLQFGFHTSTSNYETQTQHYTDYICEILGAFLFCFVFLGKHHQLNKLLYIFVILRSCKRPLSEII